MTGTDPFEAFVRKYQDMVFGTAARLLGNPVERAQLGQAVFMRAFQRFPELAVSPTAGGWLKTVTRNECLNHLTRYRARWRLFSEMTSGQDESDSNPISPSRPHSPHRTCPRSTPNSRIGASASRRPCNACPIINASRSCSFTWRT